VEVKLTTNSPKIIQRWRRICGDRGSFSYEPLDDFLWSFDPESYLESTFAALNVGTEMIDGLRALAAKHELIGDVRGSGLLIGVEMVRDRACKTPASEETARVVNGMCYHRVLISATGHEGHILKIRPPLVFSSDDAKLFLATLDEVLTALWRTPPAGLPV